MYNSVFAIFMFEILTNCYLMMSLILNTWPQNMIEFISRILVLAAEVFRISYIEKDYQMLLVVTNVEMFHIKQSEGLETKKIYLLTQHSVHLYREFTPRISND